ncbi:MAG TPA: hypothetical protein VE861_15985, partial [Gemmatimonadaceae bacterium]|nr:hypothetical protein [Gemmatimonadaceae bacterium]
MGRLGAGLAAFGGAVGLTSATAGAQPSPTRSWQPTRHAQDDWYDAIPGRHRFFFDATSPKGVGEAITFASNFLAASRSGYGLADTDNAVVLSLRHWATPFAFGDVMWAKYGAPIGERIQFKDPKT